MNFLFINHHNVGNTFIPISDGEIDLERKQNFANLTHKLCKKKSCLKFRYS